MIRVFAIENSVPFTAAQALAIGACVPATARQQAKSYRRWQDAQAHLLGRYLLSDGLARLGYSSELLNQMEITGFNRPYLPISLDFNIAHSGNYVLCTCSTEKVGIDIEAIRPIDIHDFHHCFTATEMMEIRHAPDIYEAFFRYWTIKEAVIKADGRGLNIPLHDITVSDEISLGSHRWHIQPLNVAPGYQAHLASTISPVPNIIVEWVELPGRPDPPSPTSDHRL